MCECIGGTGILFYFLFQYFVVENRDDVRQKFQEESSALFSFFEFVNISVSVGLARNRVHTENTQYCTRSVETCEISQPSQLVDQNKKCNTKKIEALSFIFIFNPVHL